MEQIQSEEIMLFVVAVVAVPVVLHLVVIIMVKVDREDIILFIGAIQHIIPAQEI